MSKQIETGRNLAFCQVWVDSEQDGRVRPDGFSLHVSIAGLERYVTEYWKTMPGKPAEAYSRPSGQPYAVGVADVVLQLLVENDGSVRFFGDYQYPLSGGTDVVL